MIKLAWLLTNKRLTVLCPPMGDTFCDTNFCDVIVNTYDEIVLKILINSQLFHTGFCNGVDKFSTLFRHSLSLFASQKLVSRKLLA